MSEPYTDYSGKYHPPERIYNDDVEPKESPLAILDPFNNKDPWGALGVGLASAGLKAMERTAAGKLARTGSKAISTETKAATTGFESAETAGSESVKSKPRSTAPPTDWAEIVRKIETNPNSGDSYEVLSPIERLQRTLNINPEKAEELRLAQIKAFERLDPEARASAVLFHGDPLQRNYWYRNIRTATLDPEGFAAKGTQMGTHPETGRQILGIHHSQIESGPYARKGYSVVDRRLDPREQFRVRAHEEGHAQQADTLSPIQQVFLRMGEYQNMPGEIGARIRQNILTHRHDIKDRTVPVGGRPMNYSLLPIEREVLDKVVPQIPEVVGNSPFSSPEIMDRLKHIYYPHFHVKNDKKQPGMETTRMA
jgi:hypothetical protein